jgi:hypothetical protein
MSETPSSATTRISSFVLLVIFITLALSLVALILAIQAWYTPGQEPVSGYLLLIGFLGAALSTYVLFQTRKRIKRLSIKTPSVTTTIECRKCGFKSVREFERGDYIFKDVDPCQKCNENMLITAIYREVEEKRKKMRF